MIKIIIADDHRMFRESLKNILITEKVADVIAEASNGEELLDLLKVCNPDIILMDIAMPVLNGIDATKKALQKHPGLKILALSGFDDEKYYYSMIEAGAKGFVLKNSGIAELKNAIIEVYENKGWFSQALLQNVITSMHKQNKKKSETDLSEREIEVLKLICQSLTNEQIADKLNLSYETVKWHRSNILSKSGSTNTAGLVIYAIKNKIIEI